MRKYYEFLFLFLFIFLPETEDTVTLYDDKSNNVSNSNIVMCNAMCSFLSNIVSKIILDTSFEFKSKDKYERKMVNRLKRNFKRKNYISFCLMSQVLFFFGTRRWTNGKRMKQNKSCLNMWRHRISPIRWYRMWNQSLFHCHVNEEKGWINSQRYIIDLTSCSTYRHFSTTC